MEGAGAPEEAGRWMLAVAGGAMPVRGPGAGRL